MDVNRMFNDATLLHSYSYFLMNTAFNIVNIMKMSLIRARKQKDGEKIVKENTHHRFTDGTQQSQQSLSFVIQLWGDKIYTI